MKIEIIFNIVAFFLLGTDIISTCIGCGGMIENNGSKSYTEVGQYRSENCVWTFIVSEDEILHLKLGYLKIYYHDGLGEKQCGDSYIRLKINGKSVQDCKQLLTLGSRSRSTCYTFSRSQNCNYQASSSYSCSTNDIISSGSSMEVQYYAEGVTPSGRTPTGIRFQYRYIRCNPSGSATRKGSTTATPATTTTRTTTKLTTTTTTTSTTTTTTTNPTTTTATTPTTTTSTSYATTERKSTTSPTTATRPATSRRGGRIIQTTTHSKTAHNLGDEEKGSVASTTIKSAAYSKQSLPSMSDEMISGTATMSIKYQGPEHTVPYNNPDTNTIIVIAAGAFLLFLAIGIIVFFIRRRRRIRNGHMQQSVSLHEYGFENAYAEATGSAELKENALYGGVDHETVETAAVNKVASEGATAPVVYAAVNKAASATVTAPAVYAEVNKVASESDRAQIDNKGPRTQEFSTFKCD